MGRSRCALWLLPVALTVAAPTCETTLPVRSADVATRDIELHLTVVGDATSTRWLAWLLGPHEPVPLDAGDVLLVDGVAMRDAGDGAYEVERPAEAEEGVLIFAREGDAEDARVALRLPALPQIAVPAEASRGAPLTLAWPADPAGGGVTLRLEGACLLAPIEVRLGAESLGHTFEAGELEGEGECEVAAIVTRLRVGDVAADPFARAPTRLERRGEARFRLGS